MGVFDTNAVRIATTDAEQLFTELFPYIRAVARRYAGINHAEYDDLMQESFFALVTAQKSYDPAQGEFMPFFGVILNRRFRRYINGNLDLNIPENIIQSLAKLKTAENEIKRKTGRDPKEKELCYALGINAETLQSLFKTRKALKTRSLDAPITEDGETTLCEMIPDEADEISEAEHRTDRARMAAILWNEIEREGSREIMQRRYINDESILQISKEMKLSYNKVKRMEKDTRQMLKKNKALEKYYNEYISGLYRLGGLRSFRTTGYSEPERIAIRNVEG